LYHPADRGSRGVVLEHGQLDALLEGVPPVRAGERVTVRGRLSAGAVNAGLLRALCGGAELVLSPDGPGAPPGPRWCSARFYGSLETGVACAARTPPAAGPGPARTLVGPPFPGCRLYALDDDIRPLPVGAVGSLYVGGRVVARGYLDDPAATVSRFVPDPFAEDGSRMFATGHRVRLLEEGALERLDGG
ncbi:AMP-binding protein, partial [Planomonospora corallina]